jgi:nucleotide-binding universal stress UspA family protein
MIVTMAIITTMAMPPMLRAALSRLPLGSDEKARLEREEHEEKGFVANLERLLVAVDESPNGRFASRIAGLLAGARGIPITVLHIGRQAKRQEKKSRDDGSPETAVKAAAKETAAVEKETEGDRSNDVDVTTRVKEAKVQDAIAEEARKGFGLLIVGLGNIANDEGAFRNNITRATAEFDKPLAVVAARGQHLEQPATSRFRILLPISGGEQSRRGAEVAIALARATSAPLRAVYVSTNGSTAARRGGGTVTHLQEEAVLKDVVALAERYNVMMDTTVRSGVVPEDAILQETRRAGANLVVMGVDRVPGERLSFGDTAATVLKKSKVSLLFVSD